MPATDPNTLISAAISRSNSLTASAQDAARQALSSFFSPGGTVYDLDVPKLRGTPPAYTGNMNIVADVKGNFDEAFGQFAPDLRGEIAEYITTYYPQALAGAIEDWLTNAILNGGTGIPPAIERAIWERARSRELREAVRAEQEVTSSFAAKGWSLPNGALAASVMAAQQSASDKVATLSREQAIASAEMEQKNIQFAIEQGAAVRTSVLSSLKAYLDAHAMPIDLAIDKAKILAEAQQQLWSSSADYYRAMIAEAGLTLQTHQIKADSHNTLFTSQNSTLQAEVHARASIAASVAKSLGDMAAASSGSVISTAGTQSLYTGSAT